MKFFALFIHRPVATTLLALAIALCGLLGYQLLPVSPLPQVDYPVISVTATLPGASPETMASSVATPLERSLGRIAGVNEMTSMSSLGNTRIILQFALERDINGAARDVQAAINAAQSLLPSSMPSRPYYRKVNPSDAPIMIMTLTSDTYGPGQLYDYASTQIAQRVSQIDGVGDVTIGGSSLPAVRVALNPQALFNQGVSLDAVRQSIAQSNVRQPLGSVDSGSTHYQIQTNDELKTADVYRSLIIHYNNGAPVRLSDVATVKDSVQNVLNAGMTNAKPAILVMIRRAPDANIISTVDAIRASMPELQAMLPASINLDIAQDRSPTIRASLRDVERSLTIAVSLVILVVFLFLRSGRATLIPAIAVPVSLIGTFSAMYLCGFSLNNLSLMALTVATGFVVDDAIVVLENISRLYRSRHEAAASLIARGAGGRLYRGVDEPVADRGVYSAAVYGRPAGALVPRVLNYAVGGDPDFIAGVHHADADDVRPIAAPPPAPQPAAHPRFQPVAARVAARLRPQSAMGAEPLALGDDGAAGYYRSERLVIYQHSQNLLPRAGHRPADGLYPGRPEHLFPGDEAQTAGFHDHCARRPGGG